MRLLPGTALALLLVLAPGVGSAQAPAREAADTARPAPPATLAAEERPVTTQHEVRAGGRVLRYSATVGTMPLRSATGQLEARVFYVAYTLDGADRTRRPLTFSFNGGPGSSSVWLHLGALGPRRVRMEDDGWMPASPYQLVDNDQTWLEFTDLVFIDPVGTGFSRAATAELGRKFWGLQGDIASVGDFIRLYLTRNNRWASPLFVIGESYGTTRAAGLADHLVDRGVALNGVILVSTILNFGTARFAPGNDLPYVLFLPTYTATAWYHRKLPADLRGDLGPVLEQSRRWAETEYLTALAKGDRLQGEERARVVAQLARFTGLSPTFLERSDLRVDLGRFNKELLRDENRTVGRLDSRFKGIDASQASERPDFDPSMAAIRPPYTATFNDYVRRTLGYETDLEYYILGGGIGRWDWGSDNAYVDVGESLRSAWAKNPHMRVFVAYGYYDAATPFFAAEYSLSHLRLDPTLRARVRSGYYEAGHMMYIHLPSLAQLTRDARTFVAEATAR
jgi:carboxypeptidase C (cathepsin A)